MEAPSEITLRIGEAHRVVLGGLGSAGYAWESKVEGPPGVIYVRALPPAPSSGPQPQPPVTQTFSVEHTFIIEALAPGKAEAQFILRRPWEKNVPPLRVISVRVTVVSGH